MLCPGTPGWGRADFPQGERNCEIWPEGGGAAAAERPPPRPLLSLAVEMAPGSRTQSWEPRGCGSQRRPKMPLLDTHPWLLPDGAAQDTSSTSQGGETEVATLDQGILSPPLCCTPPRLSETQEKGTPHPAFATFPSMLACLGPVLQFCPPSPVASSVAAKAFPGGPRQSTWGAPAPRPGRTRAPPSPIHSGSP